ncbi:MAG: hypothetical protein IJT71_04575 [Oscillospiraceae bacterium]|nr:hypothetical protein [Oscillospiraceae bacterium]
MRSKTSFFNPTVFWNDHRRYWPLTAGYTLLWLLLLPLRLLSEYGYERVLPSAQNVRREMLTTAVQGGVVSALIMGVLFAMAMFAYLTSPRATNGLHALPARRETLYLTHYLAGLSCQLAPQLLVVALASAVLGSHGAFDARVMGLALLALALPTLFFYSFGVLCMIFTGQILAAPVFYGVLNVVAVGVEVLVRAFAGNFLYGWAETQTPALLALSPVVQMFYALRVAVRGGTLLVEGLGWLWIYAAAGLALAALGLLAYRGRHSEAAGNTVAIGWAKPVFKYGVAFCAALALGQLVYFLFFGRYRANGAYSLVGSLACMALAGLLGYFIAEMLLQKSFRVLRSGWRGALAVMASLVALGCAMTFDLTGYEHYIPHADDVARVSIDLSIYSGSAHCSVTLDDPDAILLADAAHRAVINDKQRQQANGDYVPDDDGIVGGYFVVTYQLKNGGVVRRRYNPLTLYENELGDPSSPAAALTALYNDPSVMLYRALGRWGYSAENDPRTLPDLRFTGGYYSRTLWSGTEYRGEQQRDLSPAEAQTIFDAAVRDAEAGRVVGSLFGVSDGSSLTVALYANYLGTARSADPVPAEDESGRVQIGFDLLIEPSMTETLAAMREMGLTIDS